MKVCRSIINVFAMSLAISITFSFSALAAGRLEIRAKPGSSVHLYRAGMVDADGKASVYAWYSDVDDVSELSYEELAGMISYHFNERYADKVGTFRVGSDGSVVFDDIMDAVYYIRSDGMDPVAVILPGTDSRTGELSYDVTASIGDTALPETEAAAAAAEPKAAESEAAAVEQTAAESEAAEAETKTAGSEAAAAETTVTSASSAEQDTDVSKETTAASDHETAAEESESAEQEKSASTENETTAPHGVGKLPIAASLLVLAAAAAAAISRIRRRRAIERRRAAREERYRAWKENQTAEEASEDSRDRTE
jgi:hypothetical protein